MYYNNVIESVTNLSEDILENFVWPQESYLTSVPTTFVRGPEVYSVESAGTTYFFQSAVPDSVSFEDPVWPQDSYLPPVPTNCFFVRGPEVYSIETAGTTYYYQRAVPVSIVSDLEFPLQSDYDRVSDPVLSENTDLLNDEINDYDIVNSSASSLSSSVYTNTGNRDNDLERSDSSDILHVTDNLRADVQQSGNVLDWSIIDETLSEFCEDNNAYIENCNDGFGTDVQQNGNVLDWSIIDETLSEFYEDNNACIENCNDGSSENNVEIELSTSDSSSDYDTKALNKYLRDRLYLIALSGHLYQKESIPVVDILPIIEEELFSDVEDYDSESREICGKSADKMNSSTENITLLSSDKDLIKTTEKVSSTVEYFKPSGNYIFKESKTESCTQEYPELSKHNIPTCDKIFPLDDESYCFEENPKLQYGEKDLIKDEENVSSTEEYLKASENLIFKDSNSESSNEEYSELNKYNITTFDKNNQLDDESYCFEENHKLSFGDKDLIKSAENVSSTGEYLKSSDNPMIKESNLKSSNEEYSQLNKHLILTFDKITPPNDESLCFKEIHTLPSGDKDLVKTAEKLSSTGERDEFQTSKFPTSEGSNSEENITVSRKDLPVEGSSSPTASTKMKNPKKRKRFQKLRKWIATRLLCCVRKNTSPKE